MYHIPCTGRNTFDEIEIGNSKVSLATLKQSTFTIRISSKFAAFWKKMSILYATEISTLKPVFDTGSTNAHSHKIRQASRIEIPPNSGYSR